jgi:hypothetical protein
MKALLLATLVSMALIISGCNHQRKPMELQDVKMVFDKHFMPKVSLNPNKLRRPMRRRAPYKMYR